MKIAQITVGLLLMLSYAFAAASSWISGAADDGVAIQGYDVVAYHTQKRAVKGVSEYTHEWAGTVWRFASEEHRALFAASPEKYEPQYGGHCAVSMASGRVSRGSGAVWTMRDGKLYLNGNAQANSNWFRDVTGNIMYGDKAWPPIKAALQAR